MQYMVYVKMVNSQGLDLSVNSKRELDLAFSFAFANLFRYIPLYGLVRSLFSEVIVSKGSFPIFWDWTLDCLFSGENVHQQYPKGSILK